MVPHIDKFRFFATSSTTTTRRGGMSDFTGWGLSAEVRKYYQKIGGHFLVHDNEKYKLFTTKPTITSRRGLTIAFSR